MFSDSEHNIKMNIKQDFIYRIKKTSYQIKNIMYLRFTMILAPLSYEISNQFLNELVRLKEYLI